MEEKDLKVSDLQSTVKVLNIIMDNIPEHGAYFKKDAVEEIIDYLENKIEQIKENA